MVNLTTDLGAGLVLANPVLTASGTFGYGSEYADFVELDRLGGIIVKGTTLEPREGNPGPRMAETPGGMLNAVGLQNKGVDYFVEHIYPQTSSFGTQVIVNVSGASVDAYVEAASRLVPLEGIKAIELNISCPNVKQGGMAFGTTCEGAAQVTAAVRKVWPRHLMVKLSPNVTSIADIARAVEEQGADSVSLINTLLGRGCGTPQGSPFHHNRWTFGSGSAAGGSAHGVAGGKSRGHSRCGTRRNRLRARCPGIHHGRRIGSADRHGKLYRPRSVAEGCGRSGSLLPRPRACIPGTDPRHYLIILLTLRIGNQTKQHMAITQQIDADIKSAMLAKDRLRLQALRGIKKEFLEAKSAPGSNGELSDADAMKILTKMAKQRRESARIYSEQQRPELADTELAELGVIETYLPKALSDEELTAEIEKIIAATGAASMADMGKVMGAAAKALAGRAEGKAISDKVRAMLAK